MSTLNSLLHHCRQNLCESHVQRALEINDGLESGQPYPTLGGKRIRCRSDLIRFKLSPALRLIYQKTGRGYSAVALVTREAFDREIKRRRA